MCGDLRGGTHQLLAGCLFHYSNLIKFQVKMMLLFASDKKISSSFELDADKIKFV